MERARIGHNSRQWDIPATVSKNKRAHLVPLPQAAMDIIDSIPVFVDADDVPSPWVFPSKTKLSSHITTFSDGKEALDKASGVTDWWFHDLRRTVSTGMASLGVQPVVIEAALNHVTGQRSGVAGTYNRHAYWDERKVAFEAWANRLALIL